MGKQLLLSDHPTVQFEDTNPGCMWGMLQILDYHHWHHVKKVFPHKKRRHARYKRKTILHNKDEDLQLGVAEAEPLLVRHHSETLSTAGKSSSKNHKKGPQPENTSKEENSEGWFFSLPGESQDSNEYALPLGKDGKTTDQKLLETNKLSRDISNKSKKHSDVLEVLRVEKDLILKFLRDLDVSGKKFHQASQNNKARLTKSGSFPLTTSSQIRNIRTSTTKHKQFEIWAFPKEEKLVAGTQAPKKSLKQAPSVSDLSEESGMKQKSSIPSSRPSQELNHRGWNQLVVHRFKVLKQKIKHALMEAIHHRASPDYNVPINEKEVSKSLDDGMIQEITRQKSSNETKASDYDSNKNEVHLVRRTSSLNESLDRYTQLFEKSFSKEVKWHSSKSKSLKLTNEDKIHTSGNAPRFSRSNLSMPNLESLGFILHEVLSETNDIGNNTGETDTHVQRKSVSLPLKKDKSLGHLTETEIAETVEGGGRDVNPSPLPGKILEKIDEEVTCESDYWEDIYEPEVGDGSFLQENVQSMSVYTSREKMAVPETSYEDYTYRHTEGAELNARGSSMKELETGFPHRGSVDSFTDSLSNTDVTLAAKGTNKRLDNHFLLNNSNFKYVKDVLEFSGFMRNEHFQVLHTIDQPLNPSLLKDLDASLHNGIESSGEEIINSYDNQLLFNLVNEVLLEIYEKSPTYFPRPFSFNFRLHSMPKGQYLLNEVWARVKSYLTLRPELDQTLDDVVCRDLAKNSGWMNLQQEEECVALELEEMIFDDLLDELVF